MSTVTNTTSASGPARRVTLLCVVRSEWTKLRSLRSTWWTLLATFTVTVGVSLLIALTTVATWDSVAPEDLAGFDAASSSMGGLQLGQFAMAVLGVLAVASEYSTGGIRTTFTAVPRRLTVLGAKAFVVAAAALAVGMITAFTAFLGGQAIFASEDIDTSLAESGVLRAVVGAGLYIVGCAMFGLAVATLLRSIAAATSAVVALLFVLPLLATTIPGDIGQGISTWFTTNAGAAITYAQAPPDTVGPWAGFGAFTLQWALLLLLGALLVRHRDA